jgi:biotin carboxyl carrier protein
MKIFADIIDLTWVFEQAERNGTTLLDEEGKTIPYSFTPLGNNRFSFIHNGTSHLIQIIKDNGIHHVHLDGEYYPVRIEDEKIRELKKLVEHSGDSRGEESIVAPIPGLITRINVHVGDKVKRGDGVIILEAMKMENEIKADCDGVIQEVLIKQGSSVEKNQTLLILG